jgi:hypothetical protein
MTPRRPLPDSEERDVRRLNERLVRVATWAVSFILASVLILLLWRVLGGE